MKQEIKKINIFILILILLCIVLSYLLNQPLIIIKNQIIGIIFLSIMANLFLFIGFYIEKILNSR